MGCRKGQQGYRGVYNSNTAGGGNKKGIKMRSSFLAKTEETPRYEVTSNKISGYIQYMNEHVVIGKLMGI